MIMDSTTYLLLSLIGLSFVVVLTLMTAILGYRYLYSKKYQLLVCSGAILAVVYHLLLIFTAIDRFTMILDVLIVAILLGIVYVKIAHIKVINSRSKFYGG